MLDERFRSKINLHEKQLTFEDIKELLPTIAYTFSFENAAIIEQRCQAITKESIVEKLLQRNEGGLCYELNSLLYYFLQENGFHVRLIRGEVFNPEQQAFTDLGGTHVAILLHHEGKDYLVDTGFGGNLPLVPVPLNGEIVQSANGQFRIRREMTPFGNHVLEMIVNNKHTEWQTGYAFSTEPLHNEQAVLNDIQRIIRQDEQSPFNKGLLFTKLTPHGSRTLTATSWTEWYDGKLHKESIDEQRFQQLKKNYF
ncbi:arylamine N-acetyltransferase [Fictibacillus macauensis ZFHKF-1]|uniref:Arylamine N-acetyltransferase n=1 Tax=Fictibacillus macauensis ZFHKF-1 TaxID=1196324 RepID=I8UHM9_9BACL|nr:arylamine N-acetyltransferase [Fictibacillus macauensis]EIT86415.1 arylamine N-acetyltransferase [Fictibacillus macauensis ZFHKF-1]